MSTHLRFIPADDGQAQLGMHHDVKVGLPKVNDLTKGFLLCLLAVSVTLIGVAVVQWASNHNAPSIYPAMKSVEVDREHP